jgi:glutamate formiminotransferase
MADAFRAVEAAARASGAAVAGSEIIGLVPRAALDDFGAVAPALAAPHRTQVLEDRLAERGLG